MKTNIQKNLSRSLSTWGDKPAVVAKDGTVFIKCWNVTLPI